MAYNTTDDNGVKKFKRSISMLKKGGLLIENEYPNGGQKFQRFCRILLLLLVYVVVPCIVDLPTED
jgi:hypothetical protein